MLSNVEGNWSGRTNDRGDDRYETRDRTYPKRMMADHRRVGGVMETTPDPRHAVAQLTGVKVLFVDDEIETLEAFEMLLEALGAEVRTASSVDQAIDLVERWRPDVILSDINMPHQDGNQFIRRVRVRPLESGGMTPAIAISGRVQPSDQTRALLAGFQHHLRKPIHADDLVRAVRSVL